VVTDVNNDALYFSKSLIPAIRNSESLKSQSLSPVLRHIGIYGYRRDVLEQYVKLKPPLLEELEGLEQLRLLYHGIKVRTLKVESRGWPIFSGVDSPADLKVVEELLKTRGDFINSPEKIA
jgi:3-deoxy-manno-octulosonate cytidylyltransferase (CMP-KDO synthetase)